MAHTTITRRGFIAALSCLPFVKRAPVMVTSFSWSKTRIDFIVDKTWEGIPYHQSNASTGEWLGIRRV